MEIKNLKSMVRPYKNDPEHPYYRPFVVNNIDEKYDVFLVGINPATPIYMKDIPIDGYVDLLTNKEKFRMEYERIRLKNGKSVKSQTRNGIENFVSTIENSTQKKVLVTNVNFYPTKSEDKLKKVEKGAKNHGTELFLQVLMSHLPKVIIVHSKGAIKNLVRTLYHNKIIESPRSFKGSVKEMKNTDGPYLEFYYRDDKDKKCAIFVSEHLRFYGNNGYSFSFYRDKIINYLRRGD